LKNFASAMECFHPPGIFQAVRERQFLVAVVKVRRERGNLAVKMERLASHSRRGECPSARAIGAARRRTTPACPRHHCGGGACRPAIEWNSQIGGRKYSCSCVARTTRSISSRSVRAFSPVRGAAKEIARPGGDATAPRRPAARGKRRAAWRAACRAAAGRAARASFEFFDEVLFLLGLLGRAKRRAGMHLQFGRHGTLARETKTRCSSRRALPWAFSKRGHQFVSGKSRRESDQFSKIILERQPRALRIGGTWRKFSAGPQRPVTVSFESESSRRKSGQTRRRFATALCCARRTSSCPPANRYRSG